MISMNLSRFYFKQLIPMMLNIRMRNISFFLLTEEFCYQSI